MIWDTILGDLQVWSRRILRYRVLASNSTESPHEFPFFSGNSHLSSVWFWNQRNAHRESGGYGVRCYQGYQDKVLDWRCIRANCTSHLLHVASGATVLQSFDTFWKKLAGSGSCMRAKFWHPRSCHAVHRVVPVMFSGQVLASLLLSCCSPGGSCDVQRVVCGDQSHRLQLSQILASLLLSCCSPGGSCDVQRANFSILAPVSCSPGGSCDVQRVVLRRSKPPSPAEPNFGILAPVMQQQSGFFASWKPATARKWFPAKNAFTDL